MDAGVCAGSGHMDVASISHRLEGYAQNNASQESTAEAGPGPSRGGSGHTMGEVAQDTKLYQTP